MDHFHDPASAHRKGQPGPGGLHWMSRPAQTLKSVGCPEIFVKKKQIERRNQERTDREAAARSDSKDRREKIKVLWDLDPRQLRAATDKAQKLKSLKRQKLQKLLGAIKKLTGENELYDDIKELVDLAGWQDQEIEYLTPFRDEIERIKKHYPAEFLNLSGASFWNDIQPMLKEIRGKEKPKQAYERKRRDYKLGDRGEIENGFGNVVPISSEPFNFALTAYQQLLGISTCPVLDDIFAEGGVSMLKLQRLFGMNRNRFPKELPSFKKGRKRLYDYRALTEIMDSLLSEKAPNSGATRQGRPGGRWLNDSAVRARVLAGIEARSKAIAAPKHVADAFARMIRRYLPDSAKN